MFSETVDSIIARCGRPDRQADIVDWLNSTIRETQCRALFYKDMCEDQIAAVSDPLIWTYPRKFRQMKCVKYPDQITMYDGTYTIGLGSTYIDMVQPGKLQRDTWQYYYAASNYLTFCGCGSDGSMMSVAYYTYLPRLQYYALGQRPATWTQWSDDPNQDGFWSFLDGSPNYDPYSGVDPTPTQKVGIAKVSNWLLLNYTELLKEGVLAKVFKSIKDNDRAATSYSLYKQYQQDLMSFEAYEALNTDQYMRG